MKILVFLITIILNSNNDKLFGLWKSIEENNSNYINLKSNGDFFKINKKETKKLKYSIYDNYIQIEGIDGNLKEEPYYLTGDTLVIQSINNGKIVKKKYLRQKLAL